MITDVITHDHLFNLTVVSQFLEHFFIKQLKMVLSLIGQFIVHVLAFRYSQGNGRVVVHVPENQRLAGRWLVVGTRALISMTTSTNLPVKGTIDPIFFCSNNTC